MIPFFYSLISYENIVILILLLSCLYVSYTDIRYKKIGNLYTFGLIFIGTVSQFIFLLQDKITISRFLELFLGGFIIAYLMHLLSIWSAGDSKLFWGILMMSPPSLFSGTVVIQSPILVLLINVFAPYFFYMTAYLILKSSTQQKSAALRQIQKLFRPKKISQYLFDCSCFIGFGYLVSMSFQKIGYRNYFLKIVILLSFFLIFDKFIRKYSLERFQRYILSPLSLILIFVATPPLKLILSLLFVFLFIKLFLRAIVVELGRYLFVRRVNLFELQEGMIPAEKIIIEKIEGGERYIIEKAMFSNPLEKDVLLDVGIGALSKQKIEELQQLAQDGILRPPDNKIKIQQETIFAPIIALGAIITIIFEGPFYQSLL